MQRILDLLLNEVKVSVITREKNWPSQQAKHGRYKAPAGTPARVAYERDRVKDMGLNPDEPTGDYKTYAHYAASRTPDVKRDGALLSAPDARKVLARQSLIRKRNTDTKKLQAALKAVGGKPVTKNQAVNIMGRKRDDLRRRGAGRRATPGGYNLPVMTSKSVKDLPESMNWTNRLIKIVAENLSYRDYNDLEQQKAGSSDRRRSVMVRRRGRGARILLTRPRRGGAPR